MERLTVIFDASSLIALTQIDLLDRVEPLFVGCLIPPAIAREIAPSVRRPNWIRVQRLNRLPDPRVVLAGLGPDETEAICLALERGGTPVVLDDRSARRLAEGLGLSLVGTLALLVAAKRAGLLSEIRPSIDMLLAHNFRASSRLVAHILALAGEGLAG
ncbi:MAG: DUF3368 domain-containing protein [Thermomicrobiales bacterium]